MIPHGLDLSHASAKTVDVDLDHPIPDIATDGHNYLFATAFSGGVPLGSVVLAAPIDPMPGKLLADAMARFAAQLHRKDLRSRVVPPRREPRRVSTSVIVATRDKADDLRRCLDSIRLLDDAPIEVLVVENGIQTPDTRRVVEEAGATYLFEPQGGKSRALNRGLSLVRGDVVLFTDDDCVVERSWARNLLACFDDPLVMLSCGLVLPLRVDTPGRWLTEHYSIFNRGFQFSVLDGSRCSALDAPSVLVGNCMAVRRDFLLSIGGFPEALGPGAPMSGGGEEGYVGYRVLRAGFKIVYQPEAVVRHLHRADADRLRSSIRDYAASGVTYALHMLFDNRDPLGAIGAVQMVRDVWGHVPLPRRRGRWVRPLGLVLAEVSGLFRAPVSYVLARRVARRHEPLLRARATSPAPWLDAVAAPGSTSHDAAMPPKLSVVIPTRGTRASLFALLHALEQQEYPSERVEVIVSLDGDIDGFSEKIRAAGLQRVPVVVCGEHSGAATARNRGADRATGDILVFLDDDVLPAHERVLDAHVRAHSSVEGGCVVGPILPDRTPRALRTAQIERNWWVEHAERVRRHPRTFTDVTTGNLSVDRPAFLSLGGFTPMSYREDWEFGYRAMSAHVPVHAAPDAAVIQDLSIEAPRELDDRRKEGVADVTFVRLHPAAYWGLPMADWEGMGKRLRRVVRLLLRGRQGRLGVIARAVALALRIGHVTQRALERAGAVHRSVTLLRVLSRLAYWAGVTEAVQGEAAWADLVACARADRTPAPHLDLAAPRWEELDPRGSSEVIVSVAGVRLGHAPVSWGGVPWDRDAFARSVVEHFGPRALVADSNR